MFVLKLQNCLKRERFCFHSVSSFTRVCFGSTVSLDNSDCRPYPISLYNNIQHPIGLHYGKRGLWTRNTPLQTFHSTVEPFCILSAPMGCDTNITLIKFCKRSFVNKPDKDINKPDKDAEESNDILQNVMKDKSLGVVAKFKILFRQYGVVIALVHLMTSAFWVTIIYIAVSRGIDILPFLERMGIFDFLERMGFSYAEKLKSSGASYWLMTYLIYELAKPIRYPTTLLGSVYAVKYLRKIGYFKPPPKSATVSQLVATQRKLIRNRLKRTTVKYKDRYRRNSKQTDKKRKQFGGKNNKKHSSTQ